MSEESKNKKQPLPAELVHALVRDILGVEPMKNDQMKELFEIRDRVKREKNEQRS